jgi:hypothetical protein
LSRPKAICARTIHYTAIALLHGSPTAMERRGFIRGNAFARESDPKATGINPVIEGNSHISSFFEAGHLHAQTLCAVLISPTFERPCFSRHEAA